MASLRSIFAIVLIGVFLIPVDASAQKREETSLLVYSHTNGYRHEAIPKGVETLQSLGQKHGWAVQATEDSTVFREDNLSEVDVVVFLNTSGNAVGPDGQDALRSFVENGGGFVGVHAAADTEYEWSWYGRLVGAYFKGHPEIQEATIRTEDGSHPSTEMLPAEWTRSDEWYNYESNPREDVRVLLTLDESTYEGGTMDDDHPIAWCRSMEEGRSWYTGLGHTNATYDEDLFRAHLVGGIHWAAGVADK